jgi:predicted RNA binding protein YcfA (HicA-like mRNA interferase family)
VVAALERCGFSVIRIAGSHYQLFNERTRRHYDSTHHNRDLPRGIPNLKIPEIDASEYQYAFPLRNSCSARVALRLKGQCRDARVCFELLPERDREERADAVLARDRPAHDDAGFACVHCPKLVEHLLPKEPVLPG